MEDHARDLRDIFQKAESIEFGCNPWAHATGLDLEAFLARPIDDVRTVLRRGISRGVETDKTIETNIPEFCADQSLQEQLEARLELAEHLHCLLEESDPAITDHWLRAVPHARELGRRKLLQVANLEQVVRSGPLDAELWSVWGKSLSTAVDMSRDVAV